MSPVHVIVGDDPRAEAMWAGAFTGAVDLYRFERNVDAFERLTAAEAPIDLVVLTPAQRGPFNLSPDQFIARVLEGPLGASRCLANLHVIVVGQPVTRQHPRVMSVSTLDAAIRLVKFGEVERAPRPEAPRLPEARGVAVDRTTSHDEVAKVLQDLPFSGSVISRIWDAPDPVEPAPARHEDHGDGRRADVAGGGSAQAPMPMSMPTTQPTAPVAPAEPVPAQLFARNAPAGFMVPAANVAQPPAPGMPVAGGGPDVAPVGAPNESIEVATGPLQPARPYQLEQAGYRGPAMRGGAMNAAMHDNGGQPVPPALASQVQSMVYGGMHVGNPHDPLLTWSSALRDQAAQAPAAMPMQVQPAMHAQPPMPTAPMTRPPAVAPAAPRVVPMEPPAGAYGAPGAPAAPAPPVDPFLARAEQGGGDVAFG